MPLLTIYKPGARSLVVATSGEPVVINDFTRAPVVITGKGSSQLQCHYYADEGLHLLFSFFSVGLCFARAHRDANNGATMTTPNISHATTCFPQP